MAISMVAARLGGIIGNIVIAALLDLYCPLPTYIVAALLIGLFLSVGHDRHCCRVRSSKHRRQRYYLVTIFYCIYHLILPSWFFSLFF